MADATAQATTSSLKIIKGGVCAPQGFKAATAACGIKASAGDRDDLALI